MILVSLSDIHENVPGLKAIRHELQAADVVLLCGDLTSFGGAEHAARVVGAVRQINDRVFAVPGNCDRPPVDAYLSEQGINLHGRSQVVGGLRLIGLGGSLPALSPTPFEFTDDQLAHFLRDAMSGFADDGLPLVLLSHQPPRDTAADLAFTGGHVGSAAVRSFIEQQRPLVCFTGHIHEGRGIDEIGVTKVINPGPFRTGRYAYAEIAGELKALEIRGGR